MPLMRNKQLVTAGRSQNKGEVSFYSAIRIYLGNVARWRRSYDKPGNDLACPVAPFSVTLND